MNSIDYQVLDGVLTWLRQGESVVLVTVVRNWGSAPRPLGSLFAVTAGGAFIGSVSGGCIEDDLLARFAADFPESVSLAQYGIGAEEVRRFGLPCGGTLELVIERVRDLAGIEHLYAAIESGHVLQRHVDLSTGAVALRPSPGDFVIRYDERELVQVFGPRWRLLIVGAGAVSEYVAQMAPALDFSVYVNDPRPEQRANWRTPGVQWLEGMPDDAVLAFKPDQRTVIIALSHDPKVDDMALMEALKTDAFYVGAIGSVLSTRARHERLLTLDLTEADLARLHAPVGLAIGSRAPAEIAVSILAELVARRNQSAEPAGKASASLSCKP
jgi:xanthine dehydrogenase accessory factor